MKKKLGLALLLLSSTLLSGFVFCGCASEKGQETEEAMPAAEEVKKLPLEDGVYTVDFETDSSMFRANEAKDGKGTLTVTDGQGMVHISLPSKNIVNLYPGTAEEAKTDEAGWLFPTVDTVTYPDGLSEEVYGFDLPVPVLEEEFDVALIGKKEKWYDHKVRVEHAVPAEKETVSAADGSYTCEVTLQGGSGRASIQSPAELLVQDGEITAELVWNSPYYEFMLVGESQYDPIDPEQNRQEKRSVFEIPVELNQEMAVRASTVAMSEPHLVEYTLYFDGDTLEMVSQEPERSMELQFANQFSVDYYEDGYKLISLADGSRFLIIPEGNEIPEQMPEEMVPLCQPLNHIYLAATSAMCLFDGLERLDAIRLSGTQADGWYMEHARQAMQDGKILYAGKYSEPDYELMLKEDCSLAIESLMIGHASDVQTKLEELGIPVFIDQSSMETHPLGRTEWVKLYGALLNEEEKAEQLFAEQVNYLNQALEKVTPEEEKKTAAFFHISSSGYVVARKSGDYVTKMLQLAGADYVFEELGDSETRTSTVNLEMEQFFAAAKDADYIIYNSTIGGEIKTMDELLKKSSLLSEFKAVQNGNVWCTSKNMYQETTQLGRMIQSFQKIFSGEADGEMELPYLYRLK